MGLGPDALVFDCAKTLPVGSFWAGALGFGLDHDPDDPNDDGVLLIDPSKLTRGIYFQSVPEPKVVKNRVHLDLRCDDAQAETARLVALGARVLSTTGPSADWVVLADPEGNEFCLAT